jgi:AraC family transcriptional regulator
VVSRYIEIVQRLTCGPVTIGRYKHNSHDGALIGTTQFTVLVHEGSVFEMDCRLLGQDRLERKRIEYGDIQIHPCDVLIYKRWQTPSRMLFFAINREFSDRVVKDVFGRKFVDFDPRIGIQDPIVRGMAEAWREELRTSGSGGQILAEALGTALIVHLFRMYGGAETPSLVTSGGMTSNRLRKVVAYMEDNLNEDVGLSSLASISGLSIHHFTNVFKAETGFTPYQFLIERRLHRAKEMLLGSDMPIAQIAFEVGFSGQSHFSMQFRRATGMTPLRFRRSKTSRMYPGEAT